jgi:hypothetical protein
MKTILNSARGLLHSRMIISVNRYSFARMTDKKLTLNSIKQGNSGKQETIQENIEKPENNLNEKKAKASQQQNETEASESKV